MLVTQQKFNISQIGTIYVTEKLHQRNLCIDLSKAVVHFSCFLLLSKYEFVIASFKNYSLAFKLYQNSIKIPEDTNVLKQTTQAEKLAITHQNHLFAFVQGGQPKRLLLVTVVHINLNVCFFFRSARHCVFSVRLDFS